MPEKTSGHKKAPSAPTLEASDVKTYEGVHGMNSNANAADINVQGKTAQVFQFKQQQEVRAVLIDGEPWFVAGDVAGALAYTEATKMTRILDDDEKGLHIVETLGGPQEVLVINESGLYSAILRSRKPEAKAFKKWVTAEVLPAMRPAMTNEHWQEIYLKIDSLCSSWALGKDSKNWIFNHMRVVFSVPRFDDIPDDQFHTVMQLLETKEAASWEYLSFICEARRWFEKEVLGGGQPWTPTIKAKLTRQLQRQIILPPKTDWLALAKMVEQKAEGSAAA